MSTAISPRPSPTETPRTSVFAVLSLVFSCLSFFVLPLGFVPGIICGHLARREIRNNPGMDGDGMALAGLIIGYIFLAVVPLLTLVAVMLFYFYLSSATSLQGPIRVEELHSAASLFLAGWPP